MTAIGPRFRRASGRAAVPLLAAAAACLSIAAFGLQIVGPRTIYYGTGGLVLLVLGGALIARSSDRIAAVVGVAGVGFVVAVLSRAAGTPFGSLSGLPDTSDVPLTAAGFSIVGTATLVSGRRGSPDRGRTSAGMLARRALAY